MNKLLIFCLLLISYNTYGQGSFIKELPFRGEPRRVYQTDDGGFILFAQSYKTDSTRNVTVLKYSRYGILLSTEYVLSSTDSGAASCGDITRVGKNSFMMITGSTGVNKYFYLVDDNGHLVKRYSSSKLRLSYIESIRSTTQDNFIVKGGRANIGYILKTDSLFNILDSIQIPSNIILQLSVQKPSGNILLSGPEDNPFFPTPINFYLYDNNLNLLTHKVYFDKDHLPLAVANGWTFHYKGAFNLTNTLDSSWYFPISEYKLQGTENQVGIDLKQTNDGGYIFCGKVWNPFFKSIYLIKTDSLGNQEWQKEYGANPIELATNVEPMNDGMFATFAAGDIDINFNYRLFLLVTNQDGSVGIQNEFIKSEVKIYPNPTNDYWTVNFYEPFTGRIEVVNQIGNVLYSINEQNIITTKIKTTQDAGIYFLRCVSNKNNTTTKVHKLIKAN